MSLSPRRVLLYAGFGFAALIVILLLALTFMDWSRLKAPIERSASASLGRTVTISGPLEVRLWSRRPTLTISGLAIGNPPWEAGRPMATIERVQIQLELSALLWGQLILRHVELIHPVLYLHQDKSGRANWSFENQAPSKARAPRPASLPAVRGLVIESGRLTLVDELRRLKLEGTVQARQEASHADPRPFLIKGQGTINDGPFKLDIAGGPLRALTPEQPYPFSLAITAGENEIQAEGKVLKPFDLAGIELQVEAHGRDLAQLYYLTQIALPNSPPYRVKALIERHGNRLAVRDIAGSWGASDVSGSVDIDASTKRPSVKAELLSGHLYLKDFAAVTGSKAEAPSASLDTGQPRSRRGQAASQGSGQLFPDAHLQTQRLRAIDADLSFRATSVEAGNTPVRQLALQLNLADGILSMEPLQFEMSQGRIISNIRIDTNAATPKVRIASRATGIRLAQFKGTGAAAIPPLDGILEARAVLEGTGDSVHSFMSDANGVVTFVVPSGDIRSAFAELAGVDVAKGIGLLVQGNERMPLRCGVAQFDLEAGTAHAKNLVLDTQKVLLTGRGQIYLGPEKLDLTIQGQPKAPRLLRLRAPVEIGGNLLRPSFKLETGHLLKQGSVAAALGAVLTPLAAVLAFVDPGLAKDQNCAQLIAEAQQRATPAPHPPSAQPGQGGEMN
jgi:AsmA family protein